MTCKCGNSARYINERGELCCGICPLKEGLDSIKLSDVPKLLSWAREFLPYEGNYVSDVDPSEVEGLRNIVQRRADVGTPCSLSR